MKRNIDWSKAPEGTEFVASFPDTRLLKQWFKKVQNNNIEVRDHTENRWVPVSIDAVLVDVEYPPGEQTEQELFMSQFRDDDFLNSLSTENREELFLQALPGSSDITVELLKELLADYDVDNIVILDRQELNNFINT